MLKVTEESERPGEAAKVVKASNIRLTNTTAQLVKIHRAIFTTGHPKLLIVLLILLLSRKLVNSKKYNTT